MATRVDPFLLNAIKGRVQTDLVTRIRFAASAGVAGSGNGVVAFAEALRARLGNRNDLREAHRQIADAMREGVLDEYETSVEARKTLPSYREGPRLVGRLRATLENEANYVATAQGINFMNRQLIYDEAKHIYRMNFGTQGPGSAGGAASPVPVTLFGATVFELGFDIGPSPAFFLPKGLFFGGSSWRNASADRRGQDIFYPMAELPTASLKGRAARQKRDHPAKAIQPRRFLEAGLAALAEEMPLAYDRLMQRWLKASNESARAYLSHIRVRGVKNPSQIRNLAGKGLRVTA